MTWRVHRTAAALLLAVVLTGCGRGVGTDPGSLSAGPAGPVPPAATVPPATTAPSGAALARARALAAAWPGSAAARSWRTGYVPESVPPEWLPADAFHSKADKIAYQSGQLDLRTALPYSPETGTVTWADGSTAVLPLLPPARVLAGLRDPAAPTAGASRLAVTAIAPGARQVLTSRGRATIPVWEFTIAGYQQPFVYPAVAGPPSPYSSLTPTPTPTPATGPLPAGLTAVVNWSATSPDGLTLTAAEENGGCERPLPGQVYETDQVVVLIGQRSVPPSGRACPADMRVAPARFRLTRPLGDRDVLDAAGGQPLALMPLQPGGPIRSPSPSPSPPLSPSP
ncbi:hypothetical protein OG455_29910 [Kitasatospora sp. NBC_01287]|uniref:hypothetical protein n=1 Tax=Kitasatospora sp. NBC_01287 TaxID=2903573 RepID=UPI002253AF06|nr:hypothetical protein [Kitasatospora sp. NBC_01287]MCX4749680.1 hypothetical protein [Kitasatospora sp. NBC_01287]